MAKAKRERDAVNRMRVLHLTDLHSRSDDDFSERRDRIAEAVHEGSLDAIAVTGDLVQYTRNARQGAVALVRALNFVRDLKVLLRPECRDNVFVVPGNHDARFFPSKSGDGEDSVTKCTVHLDFETNSAFIKDVNVESPEQKAFFDRVRRGLLTKEDIVLNDRRFEYNRGVVDLLCESEVVVDGVHRLVRGHGLNVVLLNTEYLYTPGSSGEVRFHEGNIDKIILELAKPEFQKVPTIAIGHRSFMSFYDSDGFKDRLRDCRAVVYLSGHKHQSSTELDRDLFEVNSWPFYDESHGDSCGFTLMTWMGDRVEVERIPLSADGTTVKEVHPVTVYREQAEPHYSSLFEDTVSRIDRLIDDGEKMVRVHGNRGCGKTTMLRNLARLQKHELDGKQRDMIYIDVSRCDPDGTVAMMIEALPNRRIGDRGMEDLLEDVKAYKHRPVFLLDNLKDDAAEALARDLSCIAGDWNGMAIVSTGAEPVDGAENIEMGNPGTDEKLRFFRDIFNLNSRTILLPPHRIDRSDEVGFSFDGDSIPHLS